MHTPWFFSIFGLGLAASFLGAQEVSPPVPVAPPPAVVAPVRAPAVAVPTAPPPAVVKDDRVPVRERERTVYVPYEDLEKVFKDG
eukprot:gene13812-16878_t